MHKRKKYRPNTLRSVSLKLLEKFPNLTPTQVGYLETLKLFVSKKDLHVIARIEEILKKPHIEDPILDHDYYPERKKYGDIHLVPKRKPIKENTLKEGDIVTLTNMKYKVTKSGAWVKEKVCQV